MFEVHTQRWPRRIKIHRSKATLPGKRNVDMSSFIQEKDAGLQNVASIDLSTTMNMHRSIADHRKTRRTLRSTGFLAVDREGASRNPFI